MVLRVSPLKLGIDVHAVSQPNATLYGGYPHLNLLAANRRRITRGLISVRSLVLPGFHQSGYVYTHPSPGWTRCALLVWSSQPRRLAGSLVVGLPLLTLIISGIGPIRRVSQRIDDGNLQARQVLGIGVNLIWAPDGPGWPRVGTNWQEAKRVCQYLSEDGLTLTPVPQNIWRLPTADEAVRSMARHGENSGGVWNAEKGQATYEITPDKESPLWNIHSQVIYWWTATDVDDKRAYIIVYDGKVWPRSKQFGPDYLGFRCVKLP